MRYYLTTAIPYVNAHPHLGFVLEIVQTDAYARFLRLQGEEVRFLTGADENSLKNVLSAQKAGVETQQWVNQNSQLFKKLKEVFNLSYDDFIRTTEDRHLEGVNRLWSVINKRGDIYKKKYKGLYCVGSESFVKPGDLVKGLCPEHKEKPQVVEEENYFFALSHYQKQIADVIKSDKINIYPPKRKKELMTFVREGLEDFSISRSQKRAKGWGISVPNDPSQVVYVWFDALANYITALDYANPNSQLFKTWWQSSDKIIHFIGKGITRFHAIYWPAILLAAGLRLPTDIFVHGYLTINGQKISKSSGVVIDPFELAQRYDPELIRYFLLREISPTEDGDFSETRLRERYRSDLARGVGNLLSRVLSLGERISQGVVLSRVSDNWRQSVSSLFQKYQEEMKGFQFANALAKMNELSSLADRYISQEQPWKIKKESELVPIIANLVYALYYLALMLAPAMPNKSAEILSNLHLNISQKDIMKKGKVMLHKCSPLFPPLNK